MNINIDSIVRSVAVVAVGLPLTLSVTNLTNTTAEIAELALREDPNPTEKVLNELRVDLVKPCLDYYMSKVDSKLEREAKDAIDDVMGGEVNHKGICDYIVR